MLDISVSFAGLGQTWQPGGVLLDVEVTLGQNEKSSGCNLSLSDPGGFIAASLIRHSIASGGIQDLPEGSNEVRAGNSTPAPAPAPTSTDNASTGTSSRGAGFTPERLAFLDVIAFKETGSGFGESKYYLRNGGTSFSKEEAAKGFPKSSGNKASGRYQFLGSTWIGAVVRSNPQKFKDFLPGTQDAGALYYMGIAGDRQGLKNVDADNFEGAVKSLRGVWVSLPGGSQSNWDMATAKQYYQDRLKFYRGSSTALNPSTKEDPKPSIENLKPSVDTPEIVKGSTITIDWGGVSFEFIHQGTEHSDSQITTVTGQGLRWILSRRKRNKTLQDVSLKQLGEQVAKAHNVVLEYQASYNPSFVHIDQSGISDYQLLIREANFAGLYVSEEAGKITIKSRDKIKDSGYIVATGSNLITYKFEDKALDSSNDKDSSLLQEEPKSSIEPLTGQINQTRKDIDGVKDQSATGTSSAPVSGTPQPGQDALINQERSRMKRVKGLPSQFVVKLDDQTLTLKPLDAIRSLGFPSPLNRIWLVDSVTHSASSQTTTLDVYSPIEVVDRSPVNLSDSLPMTNTEKKETQALSASWVYPVSGLVTSPYGQRNGRLHRGIDISGAPPGDNTGGDVVAVADGIVNVRASTCRLGDGSCGGGFGNWVTIDHGNGFITAYAHLHRVTVAHGVSVKRGQKIGVEGNTGASRGTHLHFEVWKGNSNNRIDPLGIFKGLKRGTRVTAGQPV
jgi:muramidase (phage lysozyme)